MLKFTMIRMGNIRVWTTCLLLVCLGIVDVYGQNTGKVPSFIKQFSYEATRSQVLGDIKPVRIEKFLPANFNTTGQVDYTTIVQDVINSNSYVEFPNFPIKISDKGINLRSNSILIFNKKSKLILAPSNKSSYNILNIYGKENITIFSPHIIGDRNSHRGNKGEWGMGISIKSSKSIKIINPQISNCWGDGIYIGTINNLPNRNINIQYGKINNNRRNGISIISVDGLSISDIIVSNTNGVSPQVGIDFEPNSVKDLLKNIKLQNIYTYNNKLAGIFANTTRYISQQKTLDITVNNVRDEKSKYGLGYVSNNKFSSATINGKVSVTNFSKDNPSNGFHSSGKAKNDRVVIEFNKKTLSK